ncbi:hypothetical protein BDN72DRAFT_844726 [Pluteus cervinus]|uniref:Uncharacterized protein n=1 Tax=Pluteus cervinus TaxID=181527 RepID=A0ACD3AK14_9AGAR|nr:hypothetical protein BDN72DRAFT_844726 [Pluteus cervinus]
MQAASSTQTPGSKEVAIEKLDNEIRILTEQLRRLKAQRNTFSLTHTLPDEILCEIFAIVQVYCKIKTKGGHQNRPHSVLQWLPITHVSRRWRQVALACSQLWCSIVGLPEPAIPVFLGRSGDRNLSVEIVSKMVSRNVPYIHPPALLEEIFAQNSRIQTLVVKGGPSWTQILPYVTSTPAPRLREVFIDAFGAVIPDDFYQGITPQLESLSLAGGWFTLNNPVFMNDLTTLQMLNCPGSARAWLEVLQRMRRLSLLKMRTTFPEDAGGESIPIPKGTGIVTLPQLSEFDFRGYGLERDLDFLSHLTFPSQTQFKFTSETRHEDQNIIPPLIAFLRVHSQSRHEISEMEVNAIRYTEQYHRNHPMSLQLTASADKCYLAVDINLRASALRTTNAGHTTHMAEITSLPFSTATSFTTNCEIEPESWAILSDRLPALQVISISEPTIRRFLLSIGAVEKGFRNPEMDSDEEEDEEEIGEPNEPVGDTGFLDSASSNPLDPERDRSDGQELFKSLKSVHLDRISLEGLHNAMVDAICARRDGGFPIKEIRFNRCDDVDDNFVSRVESLVDVVQCHKCDLDDPSDSEEDLGMV